MRNKKRTSKVSIYILVPGPNQWVIAEIMLCRTLVLNLVLGGLTQPCTTEELPVARPAGSAAARRAAEVGPCSGLGRAADVRGGCHKIRGWNHNTNMIHIPTL